MVVPQCGFVLKGAELEWTIGLLCCCCEGSGDTKKLGSLADGRFESGGMVTVRSAARGIPASLLPFLPCPCAPMDIEGASSSGVGGNRDTLGANGGFETCLMLSSSAGEMTLGDWNSGEVGGTTGRGTEVAAEEKEGVRLSSIRG